MTSQIPNKFYCNEKFNWLSVDLEKRQWFSCCAATPQNIDMKWVLNNPGQLINIPALVQERQQMLDGEPVDSCEAPCWKPESRGLISRRMTLPTQQQQFHSAHVQEPKNLHIVLGSTCNMTCVYCCKNESSAWLRDIIDHGSYINTDRFKINKMDSISAKISQAEQNNSKGFQTLIAELSEMAVSGKIYVTGGETMLYNSFVELVNNLTTKNDVVIYTGMGVNSTRFRNQLSRLCRKDRITILVSAENCDKFYEFNRFGNTWKNFLTNLQELERQEFSWHFSSVLSNLTVFGFIEFAKQFPEKQIKYEFCGEPEFLNVNVLDDHSKDQLAKSFDSSDIPFRDNVIQAIMAPVLKQMRSDFSVYVREFSRRRSLDLSIYPDSFVQWIHETQ